GAERNLVELALGALVDDRALLARERCPAGVVLEEVLADLGPNRLQQKTEVRRDRVAAQDGVPALEEGVQPEERQRRRGNEQQPERRPQLRQAERRRCRDDRRGESDVATFERQKQRAHLVPSPAEVG